MDEDLYLLREPGLQLLQVPVLERFPLTINLHHKDPFTVSLLHTTCQMPVFRGPTHFLPRVIEWKWTAAR